MKSQARADTSKAPPTTRPEPETWGFLTTHAMVLLHLADKPGARVRDIASDLDLTERTVYRLLGDLEAAGYIDRTRRDTQDARRFAAKIKRDASLRTPLSSDPTVSQLLGLLDTSA